MKTFWTVAGIIVLIVVVVIAVKQYQKNNLVTTGNPNPESANREVITGSNPSLNGCPRGSFVCTRDPYKCCKEVPENARTTQQDFCERHGGKWDGFKCILYTQPDTLRINVVPIVKPFNPGNGVNLAG